LLSNRSTRAGRYEPEINVQVYGHIADLYAVATHPADPDVFASAAEADRVFLWNAADHNLIRTSPTGEDVRSFNQRSTVRRNAGVHVVTRHALVARVVTHHASVVRHTTAELRLKKSE
jgi:hypothetical protein